LRSSKLDDDRKTDLVHRRTPLRNPAHLIAHTGNGKEPDPARSSHDVRRNDRPPEKIIWLGGPTPARPCAGASSRTCGSEPPSRSQIFALSARLAIAQIL